LTKLTPLLEDISAFVFDFDGVLTNNLVHIDQDGKELVSCSRADGLAFDVLRKLKKPVYILSTEENQVVTARANKLKIPAIQGVKDKLKAINDLSKENFFDIAKVIYIGNDLNDYHVMRKCGYTACPSDSHKNIKQITTFVLKVEGGRGVARELLEDIFKLDLVKILYPE